MGPAISASGRNRGLTFDPQPLQAYCRRVEFEPGETLRQKGQFYRDMYLLTGAEVEVDLGAANGSSADRGTGSVPYVRSTHWARHSGAENSGA